MALPSIARLRAQVHVDQTAQPGFELPETSVGFKDALWQVRDSEERFRRRAFLAIYGIHSVHLEFDIR